VRIHDLMPAYARFVERAATLVSRGAEGPAAAHGRTQDVIAAFEHEYVEPNRQYLAPLFADMEGWSAPLRDTLSGFDPARGRKALETTARRGYPDRARATVDRVEEYFGRKLDADLVLLAGFGRIDGYARFERGRHVVYIGVDYPDPADHYLDLIIAHEVGHVYREGDPGTWTSLSLDIDMTHDQFTERCPFEEHMLGEGLSTALSEQIYPGYPLHEYLYFTREQFDWCRAYEKDIAAALRRFRGTCEAHYGLYARDAITPGSPERTQYFEGWMIVRRLVQQGKDLRELFKKPAKEILEMAGEA
jgi:hypothetical protein